MNYKKRITQAYECGQVNSNRKKMKKGEKNDLDEAVFIRFKMHAPIISLLMVFSLNLKSVSGEENSVAPEMTTSWNETYLPSSGGSRGYASSKEEGE